MISYFTESCFPGVLFELCRNPNSWKIWTSCGIIKKTVTESWKCRDWYVCWIHQQLHNLKLLEDTGVPNENDVYGFQTGYKVHCLSAYMGVMLHCAALYFVTCMPFVPSSVLSTQSKIVFYAFFLPFLAQDRSYSFTEWILWNELFAHTQFQLVGTSSFQRSQHGPDRWMSS